MSDTKTLFGAKLSNYNKLDILLKIAFGELDENGKWASALAPVSAHTKFRIVDDSLKKFPFDNFVTSDAVYISEKKILDLFEKDPCAIRLFFEDLVGAVCAQATTGESAFPAMETGVVDKIIRNFIEEKKERLEDFEEALKDDTAIIKNLLQAQTSQASLDILITPHLSTSSEQWEWNKKSLLKSSLKNQASFWVNLFGEKNHSNLWRHMVFGQILLTLPQEHESTLNFARFFAEDKHSFRSDVEILVSSFSTYGLYLTTQGGVKDVNYVSLQGEIFKEMLRYPEISPEETNARRYVYHLNEVSNRSSIDRWKENDQELLKILSSKPMVFSEMVFSAFGSFFPKEAMDFLDKKEKSVDALECVWKKHFDIENLDNPSDFLNKLATPEASPRSADFSGVLAEKWDDVFCSAVSAEEFERVFSKVAKNPEFCHCLLNTFEKNPQRFSSGAVAEFEDMMGLLVTASENIGQKERLRAIMEKTAIPSVANFLLVWNEKENPVSNVRAVTFRKSKF